MTETTINPIPLAERTDPQIATVPVGEFNIFRLRYVVQWAIDEDHFNTKWDWNQGTWGSLTGADMPEEVDLDDATVANEYGTQFIAVTCATSCCIAGNAVMSAGDKFAFDRDDFINGMESRSTYAYEASACVDRDGEFHSISYRGKELLGITDEEADWLFGGDNEIDEVCYIAEWIAQEHGTTLNLPDAEVHVSAVYERSDHLHITWPVPS